MKCCQSNHSVFPHTSERGKIVLIIYVDDKVFLQTSFWIKDLGKLHYFLGIEVARSKEGNMCWKYWKKQACWVQN
jgi:hypothetical protein